MPDTQQEKSFFSGNIHYFITIALCFGIRYLPPFAELTPFGMAILGSFVAAVYGWTFCESNFTSLVALLGIGLSIGMPTMVAAAFNPTVMSILFMYLLIGLCNETGAFDMVVNKILTSKAMLGKPWIMIWIVFFAAMVIGGLNSIVMIVVFMEFLLSICKQTGIPFKSKTAILWALGIVYAIAIGQIMLPFYGFGLTLIAVYSAMFQATLDFTSWLLMMVPMDLLMITVYTLLMRFVFRCDVTPLKNMTPDMLGGSQKATRDQKISLVFFVVFILLMMSTSIQQLGILNKITVTLGVFGITIVMLSIMMLFKRENGERLVSFRAQGSRIGWESVLISAYIMVVGNYMNVPDAGIAASLNGLLAPLTQLPPYIFIIAALGIGAVLTNFATNLIIIIIIMPAIIAFTNSMGIPALGVLCLLYMSCHICIATPAASPYTGICFSSPLMDKKLAMKYGWIMVVLLFIVQMTAGLIWMNVIM